MEKAVVFGVGRNYHEYKTKIHSLFDVVALIDNNPSVQQGGARVLTVERLLEVDYDIVIITPCKWKDMYKQLLAMGVAKEKIAIMLCMPELTQKEILGYKYWGQHCDDLVIASIFARIGIEKPSYIDLGANLPALYSNTCLLYRQGCRGINIEANPTLAELFEVMRPEDITLNVGVALKEGVMNFYKFDEMSGLNTFSKQEAEKWNMEVREVVELPVTTLKKIMDKYCPNGFPDFLDCDIEGLDYAVLEDYDLFTDGPKVICVEVRKDEILKFDTMLDMKDYFRFCRIGENNIYVRKEYAEVLSHMSI